MALHQFLPIGRWGGEPPKVVEGYWPGVSYPSTMLRMVPLPAGLAGREELQ